MCLRGGQKRDLERNHLSFVAVPEIWMGWLINNRNVFIRALKARKSKIKRPFLRAAS